MAATSLLSLYHRLPPPARSAVATARGLYLRSWRYGSDTDRIVAEALARDHEPPERLAQYRQERLRAVLERAATRVPYYRDQWAARRRQGDRSSWERLEHWPILDKNEVRVAPERFVADDCDRRRMFDEHTSGTTGTPLTLWWSRRTVRTWYGLAEARWRKWYNVSRHDRWAILGGQLVTPVSATRPPYWVWNPALRQLYMSSIHLSPSTVRDYASALERYRVRYLFGYPSALASLAQEILWSGLTAPPMTVAITNAEPLFEHQRQVIRDAFHCDVRETYGMSEIVAAAGECEHGRLHLWPEVGVVEVMNGGEPVPDGTAGDLVCTGLLNIDMPLIRYRNGDRGALLPASPCACGRTLPAIAGIDGRSDDVVITPSGRSIGRLDTVFKHDLPVREAQIVQDRIDRLRVRYVPGPGFGAETEAGLIESVRRRVGDMTIVPERVDRIARTANGKFRAVISELPPETIGQVRARARGEHV